MVEAFFVMLTFMVHLNNSDDGFNQYIFLWYLDRKGSVVRIGSIVLGIVCSHGWMSMWRMWCGLWGGTMW